MLHISGTIYGTHLYKRIISPGIFFIFFLILIFGIIRRGGVGTHFTILIFEVFREVKGQKMT